MGKHHRLEKDFHFDYHFLPSLGTIAKLVSDTRSTAALILTLVLAIASEYAAYKIGMIPGKMYGALTNKNEKQFWDVFTYGSVAYLIKCLLTALEAYASWLLYLYWRKNAVQRLQELYLKNRSYYRLNCIDNDGIDNPDQRITQDVERMTNQLAVNIMPSILIGPFVIAYYTYKTSVTAGSMGVGIVYGYFVIGTIVNKFLVSPMVKWNARVERAEGDFRYKHVSIRTNAESVALYEAETFEYHECSRIFMILWGRQFKYLCWKLPNYFWQQFFDYYGGILSYAIQFIPIFILHIYDSKTPAELATIISNNAFVYIYLVNSFTRITDVALNTGEMAGIMQRVAELVRNCRISSGDNVLDGYYNYATESADENVEQRLDSYYEISDLSYSPPSNPHRDLIMGLTVTMKAGDKILVTGPSGCGKSSLIRVLARLWAHRKGSIKCKVDRGQILRLPQIPYFPVGHLSLFQQISFPETAISHLQTSAEHDYLRITEILASVDLGWLLERSEGLYNAVDFEWQETLTPGERQRLSFARLLYQQPFLAILDESTSSVSLEMQERMYELLYKNGINYISIGHHPSLVNFHDMEIHFNGDGNYEIRSLNSQFRRNERLSET